MTLEDLRPDSTVRGILPDAEVTVVSVQWHGSDPLTLVSRGPDGRVADEILYRHDERRLEIVRAGRPWSLDGDGALYRRRPGASSARLPSRLQRGTPSAHGRESAGGSGRPRHTDIQTTTVYTRLTAHGLAEVVRVFSQAGDERRVQRSSPRDEDSGAADA